MSLVLTHLTLLLGTRNPKSKSMSRLYRFLTVYFLMLSLAAWAGDLPIGPENTAKCSPTNTNPTTEKDKNAIQLQRMQQLDEMATNLLGFQANFERALFYLVSFHSDLQKFQMVESDMHRSTLYTKARIDYMEAKRFLSQAEIYLQQAAYTGNLNEAYCAGVKGKMDQIQTKWVVIQKSMRLIEYDLMNGSYAYSQQVLSGMGKDIEILMREIGEVAAIGKSCVAAGAI